MQGCELVEQMFLDASDIMCAYAPPDPHVCYLESSPCGLLPLARDFSAITCALILCTLLAITPGTQLAGLGVPQTIGDIATQCGEFDAQNVFREPNVHVGDGLEYIWLDTA